MPIALYDRCQKGCIVTLNALACTVSRLTSAEPERLGAFWRLLRVPVLGGFETVFTFQVLLS